MSKTLKPTQIYDAKKRVMATAPPVVKAVLNGTYFKNLKKEVKTCI
tara:strand:- start:39 stop:176 length:138 start_codon:yes stop_codon:yes gene_type:complete